MSALCVADGEGRNSVWLASKGLNVAAFDFSPVAVAKARAVQPGGLLILEGYGPKQIEYATGGPKKLENLYTEELLRGSFAGLEILHLASHDAEVDEGAGHKGMSALVDLVARRVG